MDIKGRVTSVMVFEGRSNLFILHVQANEFGGTFNCDFDKITLDRISPIKSSDIAQFVESRHVLACLIGVDDSTGGTGSRKCDRIELQTILD